MSELPLKLEPADRIVFAGKKLGDEPSSATLKITNPTGDRMAFKIKCTSNEMFRIRPVIGVVKPKEDTTATLIFNAGKSVPDSGKHYFAVYAIKAPDEKKNGRSAWQEHKGNPEGQKKLYIDFKKESEEDKKEKEDDKEEDKKGEEKKDDKKEEAEVKKEDKKEPEKKDDDKKDADKKDDDKKEDDKKDDEKKEE